MEYFNLIGKMVGENPLGWLLPDPSCKKQSQGALLKGDMGPNEYPLYKVYIWGGWLVRVPSQGAPTIFPQNLLQ